MKSAREVQDHIKQLKQSSKGPCEVVSLEIIPEPPNQRGKNCAYYAGKTVLFYWNSLLKTPFIPARKGDTSPRSSTSLRGIGKKVLPDFGIGQIFDVTLFENIAKEIGFQCAFYEFEAQSDLVYLVSTMLKNGFPVIIPIDYSNDKAVQENGARPHFVTIVSLFKDNLFLNYKCIVATHDHYLTIPLSDLYKSCTNLKEFPCRLYKKEKDESNKKFSWAEVPLDSKRDSEEVFYEFHSTSLHGLQNKLVLMFPSLANIKFQSLDAELQIKLKDPIYIIENKVEKKFNLLEKDEFGKSVIDYLAELGNTELVFQLLADLYDQGFLVNLILHENFNVHITSEEHPLSLFHYAVYKNDKYLMAALITAGGNIETCYAGNKTILDLAIIFNAQNVIPFLINKNMINHVDIFDRTPLHLALYFNLPIEIIKLLIDEDNINKVDYQGSTPLMYAVCLGDSDDVIAMLIAKGADIYKKNNIQESPFDIVNKTDDRKKAILIEARFKKVMEDWHNRDKKNMTKDSFLLFKQNRDAEKHEIKSGEKPRKLVYL